MFPSISSLFGGSDSAQPAAAAPTTPNTASTPATPGNLPPEGSVSAVPPGTTPDTPASPLDQYKELWEPVSTEGAPDTSSAQLDPAKLQEVIAKSNFSNSIPQETLAAITQGGEGATEAFANAMNSVAQNVMQQTILATHKMNEQAISKVNESWEAKLPSLMKQQSLTDNLATENPIFNNPAVKPVIEAAKSMLAVKNPDATTAELAQMTKDYVAAMTSAFTPAPPAAPDAQVDTDWNKYMQS